jgi:uncharacterized membrane protein
MIAAALPLHPLLVHAPVVLIPLTLIMVLPGLFNKRWFNWLGLATVAVSFAAAAFAWGATFTGESLEHQVGSSDLIEKHSQLGDMARNLAFLTFVAVAARWALFAERAPEGFRKIGATYGWLETALAILTAALSVAATVWVFLAGHSGATAVWTQ